LSIYYFDSSSFEYLGGAVSSANFAVSVTSSRPGQYLLTAKPAIKTALRPDRAFRASQLIRSMVGDHTIEVSFALQGPSRVNVRLLTLHGRLVFESTTSFQAGMQKMRLDLPVHIPRFSPLILEIRSQEFRGFRIVQL